VSFFQLETILSALDDFSVVVREKLHLMLQVFKRFGNFVFPAKNPSSLPNSVATVCIGANA
jgi:hypothetical protein